MSMSVSRPTSKRAVSELDIYEEKPDITSDSASDTYRPNPQARLNKNKNKKSKSCPEERNSIRKWTEEEDRIFLQLMSNLVKTKLWDTVKEDGRLGYRGSSGIKSHAVALLNKLKKA